MRETILAFSKNLKKIKFELFNSMKRVGPSLNLENNRNGSN